ncbi:HlyD family secretion protein [Pseudogemmobacter sonorensis]|uniref:HlyD family secretion protein n=1 Tax=Pseudogemmobacter sonorensis TaxID=2989681 RepID=UPI00369B032E
MAGKLGFLLRRGAKFSLGLGALGVAGWTMGAQHLQPYSAEAVLNAPLVSLMAPGEGALTDLPAPGHRVSQGERIFTISAFPRIGGMAQQALVGLGTESARRLAEVKALHRQIDELQAIATRLAAQAETYRTAQSEQLALAIAELESRLSLREAQLETARRTAERVTRLRGSGAVSENELESALLDLTLAERELAIAESQLAQKRHALEHALTSTFLGDAYNDVSYSMQRHDEVMLRIADLTAQMTLKSEGLPAALVEGLVGGLVADLPEGGPMQVSFGAQPHDGAIAIASPVQGRVWSTPLPEGMPVSTGETVIEIADCSRMTVVADISRRGSASITQGARIGFTPTGSAQTFAGTVIRLADGSHDQRLAIAAPRGPEAVYQVVAVLDPAPALAESCAIGALGRIALWEDQAPPAPSSPRGSVFDGFLAMIGMGTTQIAASELAPGAPLRP